MIDFERALRIDKIKAEMAINGDTKSSLAKKLEISRSAFISKLNGTSEFKLSELEKLAYLYDKPRNYFF